MITDKGIMHSLGKLSNYIKDSEFGALFLAELPPKKTICGLLVHV